MTKSPSDRWAQELCRSPDWQPASFPVAARLAALGTVSPTLAGIAGAASGISTLVNSATGSRDSFSGGAVLASDYVAQVYARLLALQESRQPITVVTGLRSYDSMLITSLRARRDVRTAYVLMVNAFLKQVILVDTQPTAVPPQANQANPASTADIVNTGVQRAVQVLTPNWGSYLP